MNDRAFPLPSPVRQEGVKQVVLKEAIRHCIERRKVTFNLYPSTRETERLAA